MATMTPPRNRFAVRTPASARRMPLYLDPDPNARISLRSARRKLEAAVNEPGGVSDRMPGHVLGSTRAANDVAHATQALVPSNADADVEEVTLEPLDDAQGAIDALDVVAGSHLLGRRVMSSEGEAVGAVREIMADLDHGRLAYAIVACAIGARATQRLFAVPWSAFVPEQQGDVLTLNMTREALLAAPSFEMDRWPDLSDPYIAHTVHAYFGQRGYWEGDRP